MNADFLWLGILAGLFLLALVWVRLCAGEGEP